MSRRLKMSIVEALPRPGRNRAASSTPLRSPGHPPRDGAADTAARALTVTRALDADENGGELQNHAWLDCVVADHPLPDRGRAGEPVASVAVLFCHPEGEHADANWGLAGGEVVLPEPLASGLADSLQPGTVIQVVGQMTAGGRVRADAVHFAPLLPVPRISGHGMNARRGAQGRSA
jgi:hypothetical protein